MLIPIMSGLGLITSTLTSLFPLGGGFDQVNRRFLFTMTNKSRYSFRLVDTHQWYGNLDAPLRELDAGNSTQMGILQIRGYKQADKATGVTYSLCFKICDNNGDYTQYRLNVYLQVGYSGDNYFGWFIRKEELSEDPQRWYNGNNFNRHKADCEDGILNKGGSYSLDGKCAPLNLNIRMYTDNEAWSTPSMNIE